MDDEQQKQGKSQMPQNPSKIAYNERIALDDRMFIPVPKRASGTKKAREYMHLEIFSRVLTKKNSFSAVLYLREVFDLHFVHLFQERRLGFL